MIPKQGSLMTFFSIGVSPVDDDLALGQPNGVSWREPFDNPLD